MRLRLILSFALVVLVAVSSVVIIARQGAAREVRAFMFHGGMAGHQEIVTALEAHYATHHTWQGAETLLTAPTASPGQGRRGPGGQGMGPGMMSMMNQHLRLADAGGNLVADTDGAQPAGQLTESEMRSALPLSAGGKVVGYLLPEGGMSFAPGDEAFLLDRLSRAALTAGLIAGGVALLLALLLAYGLARPVRALTTAANRLAQGDLSQRVEAAGGDELTTLGQAFNQMAASLQEAEVSRRAMTADIAHELRTPLAIQRAHLEALQDGIYPLTVENLSPILEQNDLLTRLVADLRTLALADAGQLGLERSPTDFPALSQRTIERFKPQAEAQQIDLSLALPSEPPPLLFLDPLRVEQILGNLVSNALHFTPPGGQIECRVTSGEARHLPRPVNQPAYVTFTIRDSGPGIPPETLPHIFERFYRADKSRSRAEGGSGLGLAIARQLAELHDGRLTAANHPEKGAIFTLTLPLITPGSHQV